MRGLRKPAVKHLPICFIILIFFIIYTIYIEFVCIPRFQLGIDIQYRLKPRREDIADVLKYHALIILLIWSFVMTSVTEPGYISRAWKVDSNCIYECNERKRNGEFRYCKIEECYKPDRAHFCRQLGRNVLKMDHYCPWVSNCIGFYNYKFFFQTLVYSNTVNIFMLNRIYHEFLRVYYDQNSTFNELFYLALIGTLIAIITLIIFPFMLFHLWLISINKTTIEFCEWKASGSYNYNLGIISNFGQVFGTNILHWFLPIGYPPGDGIHFKGGLKYRSVLSL